MTTRAFPALRSFWLSAVTLGLASSAGAQDTNQVLVSFSLHEGLRLRTDVMSDWDEKSASKEAREEFGVFRKEFEENGPSVSDDVERKRLERLWVYERYVATLITEQLTNGAPFHRYADAQVDEYPEADDGGPIPGKLDVLLRKLSDDDKDGGNKFTGTYVLELNLSVDDEPEEPVVWSFLASDRANELTPRRLCENIQRTFQENLESPKKVTGFVDLMKPVELGLPSEPRFFQKGTESSVVVTLPTLYCLLKATKKTEFELLFVNDYDGTSVSVDVQGDKPPGVVKDLVVQSENEEPELWQQWASGDDPVSGKLGTEEMKTLFPGAEGGWSEVFPRKTDSRLERIRVHLKTFKPRKQGACKGLLRAKDPTEITG